MYLSKIVLKNAMFLGFWQVVSGLVGGRWWVVGFLFGRWPGQCRQSIFGLVSGLVGGRWSVLM